jgi:protein-tyrosine phosphatase
MPWIENCAAADIPLRFHHDAGPNSMLIQIMDPASWFPEPKHEFKEIHHFEFLDIEDGDEADDPEMFISTEQAKELVRLLRHALDKNMNVVVHCYAGVSRSGAVATVGEQMGFMLVEGFRSPNTRVMRLMMEELSLPYEPPAEHRWQEEYRNYLRSKNNVSTS